MDVKCPPNGTQMVSPSSLEQSFVDQRVHLSLAQLDHETSQSPPPTVTVTAHAFCGGGAGRSRGSGYLIRVHRHRVRSVQAEGSFGELLDNVRGGVDALLGGGLNDLLDRFKQNGQGEVADSWVRQGPNQQVTPQQLEQAIGPDGLATLSKQTGLSREELLSRLSRNLPDAVDKYTPDGRIPATAESARS